MIDVIDDFIPPELEGILVPGGAEMDQAGRIALNATQPIEEAAEAEREHARSLFDRDPHRDGDIEDKRDPETGFPYP